MSHEYHIKHKPVDEILRNSIILTERESGICSESAAASSACFCSLPWSTFCTSVEPQRQDSVTRDEFDELYRSEYQSLSLFRLFFSGH